jgi:hypothetical protein
VATPGEVRRAVIALTDRQDADVRRAWSRIRQAVGLDPIRARNALAQVLPAIGDTYGSAASALAADIYDGDREAAGVKDRRGRRFRATAAPLADQGRYDALAGWAVGPLFGSDPDPEAVASKIAGGMQRTTADAFRETITVNAKADPSAIGWRRIGHGATCDFCRMLINRGAVYTEETAKFRAHDNCKCTAAAAFKGEDIGPLDPAAMGTEADELSPIESEFLRVQGEDRPQYVKSEEFIAESDIEAATMYARKRIDHDNVQIKDSLALIEERKKQLAAQLSGNEDLKQLIKTDYRIKIHQSFVRAARKRVKAAEAEIAEAYKRAERGFAQARLYDSRADEVARFRKGAPMDPDTAAKGTNQRWHIGSEGDVDYQTNCTRCATAYEMRRRGYDVKARGVTPEERPTKYTEAVMSNWRTKDGSVRKPTDTIGRVGTEEIINDWPVGARGFISGAWKSGGGHIWNVERTKDGYIFVEAQIGRRAGIEPIEHNWSQLDPFSVQVARVDDLVPTNYVGVLVEPV